MKIEELHKCFLSYPYAYIDSRKDMENKGVFFALQGKDDGNIYASEALEKGCAYAIVDNPKVVKDERYLLVENVLDTLQQLSKYHREYCGTTILALTGSNGKTTTKELIKKVLETTYSVVATTGNLNNHIGVPLTLLRLTTDTEIGIIEMGASGVGEIGELCKLTLPDMGLITNIGDAHSEKFGSFENIAKTKAELFDDVSERNGLLFVNTKNEKISEIATKYKTPLYSYGIANAQITGKVLKSMPYLKFEVEGHEVQTKLYGRYNIENVLAAYTVGLKLQVAKTNIIQAISDYAPTNKRSQCIETKHNFLIMDAYNANASSMEESLLDFVGQKEMPDKFCILGDMKELANATEKHRRIKELLLANGFKHKAFLVGSIFCSEKDDCFTYFNNVEELQLALKQNPMFGKQILIKGSRSIGLEVVENLL